MASKRKRRPPAASRASSRDQADTATPQAATKPRSRRRLIFGLLFVIVLAYPAYRGYRVYRLRSLALQATEARRVANWPRLEATAVRWGQQDPDIAEPWLMAAEAAEHRGAYRRVADHLEKMPPDDPRTPAVLLELATLYFDKLNSPKLGVAACQRVLRLRPDDVEAHRRLIFYYGITLQRNRLLEQTREAIANGGDSRETYVYLIGAHYLLFSNAYEFNAKWLLSGQNTETFAVGRAFHARGAQREDSQDDVLDGVDAERRRDLKHRELLEQLLTKYPQNPELLAHFLQLDSLEGDVEKVKRLLGQVPESLAEDARFWHYKGWIEQQEGRLADAEQAYRRSLELYPYGWRTQLQLAEVVRQQGQLEEAQRLVKLSLEGKQLRQEILELPDVQSVPYGLFLRMKQYAEGVGDTTTATRMQQLVEVFQQQLEASKEPEAENASAASDDSEATAATPADPAPAAVPDRR